MYATRILSGAWQTGKFNSTGSGYINLGRTSTWAESAGKSISKAILNLAGWTTSWLKACAAAEHGTPWALESRCATLALTGSVPCPSGLAKGRELRPFRFPKFEVCKNPMFEFAGTPRLGEGRDTGKPGGGCGARGDGEGSGEGLKAIVCMLPPRKPECKHGNSKVHGRGMWSNSTQPQLRLGQK